MIIKQTKQAIKFYELAIKNAQAELEFQVNQDEKYQKFQSKYEKLKINTLFHSHNHVFRFYTFEDISIEYFRIEDGEIIYANESDSLENVKEIAQELLNIVKKFYE